jgi:hypothetical protein
MFVQPMFGVIGILRQLIGSFGFSDLGDSPSRANI